MAVCCIIVMALFVADDRNTPKSQDTSGVDFVVLGDSLFGAEEEAESLEDSTLMESGLAWALDCPVVGGH